MRLIDADALQDVLYHEAFETDSDMQRWDSGCWIRYKMFENAIDNAPTIEPKLGEWIIVCDAEGEGDNLYRCSVCGCEYGCQEYDLPKYCGECGSMNHSGKTTEKGKQTCPKCGKTEYIRSFVNDFGIKDSKYRYKCINCNTYIK